MGTERWDDWLVVEHELIERAMAVLHHELEALEPGKPASLPLERAVDFLSEFGDKMHNMKEELFLFPLMGKRGVPSHGGPIAVMLMEHEAERSLLERMVATLPTLRDLERAALARFAREARDYLDVRAGHIWKENDVLYAMGRQVLQEEDNARLLEQFATLDAQTYGARARIHYATMIEEVESVGKASRSLIHNLSHAQLDAIMEALPVDVTFVDAQDTVAYFNRLDREKIFVRTRSVIGRKVEKCHPAKSVDQVLAIVEGFKAGTIEGADFWIDFRGSKVLIRYFPVRDREGAWLGVLEVTQDVGWIQRIEGQKRLLDG